MASIRGTVGFFFMVLNNCFAVFCRTAAFFFIIRKGT